MNIINKEDKIQVLKEVLSHIISNPVYDNLNLEFGESATDCWISKNNKILFINRSGDEFVRLISLYSNLIMSGIVSQEKVLQEVKFG